MIQPMAPKPAKSPPYRWEAFRHWLHLSLLAATGVAGAVFDPVFFLLAVPLEMGALWILPDLPSFKARVDQMRTHKELMRERSYCLDQLWGLRPEAKSWQAEYLGWLVEVEREDLDSRVLRSDREFERYRELKEILQKLTELETVRGDGVVTRDTLRFEQVINGYLRYLIACDSLNAALRTLDADQIQSEIEEIEAQLPDADQGLRAVLLERLRLRAAQRERLPKLRATLELFRTRAETIVYQMRDIHGQALADPGMNVHAFLEDLLEKQELMADPLGDLEADRAVRELLSDVEQTAVGRPPSPGRAKAVAAQAAKLKR
jgi:predicted DNA-binding transcriptional regulator